MFQEVEDIEIFKVSRMLVPENSRCVSYCLFSRLVRTSDMYKFCQDAYLVSYPCILLAF